MALVISFQSLKPSMERVNHLLSMHREPYHPHTKNPFEGVSTVTVSLDDVTFGFDGKAPVLNSISLHAEP